MTQNGGFEESRVIQRRDAVLSEIRSCPGIFRMPAGGGPEERIGDLPPSQDWNVVPGAIYYLDPGVGEFVVKRMDLTTGRTTDALKLPKGTLGGASNFTVSPDSRWLVFVHVDHSLNELMMIEGSASRAAHSGTHVVRQVARRNHRRCSERRTPVQGTVERNRIGGIIVPRHVNLAVWTDERLGGDQPALPLGVVDPGHGKRGAVIGGAGEP